MCLAVPGLVEGIDGGDELTRCGRIRFGDIVKRVNLSFVPEASPGDFVLVHAGFAITTIDQAEAERVFEYLRETDGLEELQGGSA
jgi:hydrogenase expression/formation protein HypC